MKLVVLNVWAGKIHDPLLDFLRRHAGDTDIFCFQELFFGTESDPSVRGAHEDIHDEISVVLSDFTSYRRLAPEGTYFESEPLRAGLRVGQAIFVRNGAEVVADGGFFAYTPAGEIARNPSLTMTGNFQYVKLGLDGGETLIGNLHGLWQKEGKGDTPARLEQARMIREALDDESGRKILCGDFNMLPGIDSMRFSNDEMRDLVTEYGVKSTRSGLYQKGIPFSDYVFVTPDVDVKRFEVLSDEVSDHLPLVLEFV